MVRNAGLQGCCGREVTTSGIYFRNMDLVADLEVTGEDCNQAIGL